MKTFSPLIKILSMILIIVSFVACSKKNDSNKVAAVPGVNLPPGVGSCVGCNWTGSNLFLGSAYGSYSFPMAMTIELFGDQNQVTQLQQQGMNPPKTYYGPTFLRQAAINVSSNITAGNCVLPAGTYTIGTSGQGSYSGGQFAIQQFEMVTGPHRYTMAMQGVIIDADANGHPEAFGAQLYVLQGLSMYGQGTVQCMDNIGFTLAP